MFRHRDGTMVVRLRDSKGGHHHVEPWNETAVSCAECGKELVKMTMPRCDHVQVADVCTDYGDDETRVLCVPCADKESE